MSETPPPPSSQPVRTTAPLISVTMETQRLPVLPLPFSGPPILSQLAPLQLPHIPLRYTSLSRLSTLEPPLGSQSNSPTAAFQVPSTERPRYQPHFAPWATSNPHMTRTLRYEAVVPPEAKSLSGAARPFDRETVPTFRRSLTNEDRAAPPYEQTLGKRSASFLSSGGGTEGPSTKRLRRSPDLTQKRLRVPPVSINYDRSPEISRPVGIKQVSSHYSLVVRQEPAAARACGFGERDRRVIDPPPILELKVTDPQTGAVDQAELRYSSHVVQVSLYDDTGTRDVTTMVQPGRRAGRRLTGTLVASPVVAEDENEQEGCFFTFSDLSCRTHGSYCLRFILIRIDPTNQQPGSSSPVVASVVSNIFTVYSAKDFPGVRPSTALTQALKRQGVTIAVKKGKRSATPKRQEDGVEAEDEEEEAEAE